MTKRPAYNERFGATAAVTPLKMTCEHERKYSAERLVKAAAAPSRHHVSRKRARASSREPYRKGSTSRKCRLILQAEKC